jgi:hypothetical protein
MTRNQLKDILDRVLDWPPERQAYVSAVVELLDKQDRTVLRLAEAREALDHDDPMPRPVLPAGASQGFRVSP